MWIAPNFKALPLGGASQGPAPDSSGLRPSRRTGRSVGKELDPKMTPSDQPAGPGGRKSCLEA